MLWLCVLCVILIIIIIVLIIKIVLLHNAINEIYEEMDARQTMEEKMFMDTNTLITVSSSDRHIRRLAAKLNVQLRLLRKERRRLQTGDRELKDSITNISHDLRTPLTAICGYLDLLAKEDKSEAVTRYLSIIENRTEALKQLTEELFRYSVITSTTNEIRLENVNLNGALEEGIASCYAALMERGITPDIQITEKKIYRRLDLAALSRLFNNILNNVIKYSDGDLEIIMLDTGEIIFTNTASQLDKVQIEKLFDRFYTVESAKKSTGLGLSIAKILTEQMNGEINAFYKDNKLSVRIYFND